VTHILTLDTLAERPVVCIDKTDYSMKLADDFGLADLARLERMQNDLRTMMNRDDLTDAEIERLVRALDVETAMILPDMPPDVRGRLSDGQKLAIVRAFQKATEATSPPLPSPASQPTGAP
jgi:hypothetical protein